MFIYGVWPWKVSKWPWFWAEVAVKSWRNLATLFGKTVTYSNAFIQFVRFARVLEFASLQIILSYGQAWLALLYLI
jgi:hypothetical protein